MLHGIMKSVVPSVVSLSFNMWGWNKMFPMEFYSVSNSACLLPAAREFFPHSQSE
jgi:hypothetical protein